MAISVPPHLPGLQQQTAATARAAATRRDRAAVDGGAAGALLDRPELRFRDLREDPRLRRAMGLEKAVTVTPRPEPRFDRRRLLERAAA